MRSRRYATSSSPTATSTSCSTTRPATGCRTTPSTHPDERSSPMPTDASAYGVHSEVGTLRKVLVCAPGLAHDRLTPSNCDDLLFDDVLWVQNAKRDHF